MGSYKPSANKMAAMLDRNGKTKAEASRVQKVRIALHAIQHQFSVCDRIYRAFVSGIGAGKSVVGAYDLCRRAQPYRTYMVVAPDFGMLQRATLRTFIEVAEKLNLWNPDAYHRTDSVAVLNNNATVYFGSGDDPDRLRGPNLSGGWLDEAQKMCEEVYHVMIGRLREGGEQGWLSLTYTPQAPDHWTSMRFERTDDPNVAFFRCKTKDNPFLPPDFYENLKRQYGELRARRELDGETLYIEGAEWPVDWFSDDIWVDEFPEPDQGVKVASLDSSKGRGGKTGDYSAFIKLQWHDSLLYTEADMANDRDSAAIASTAVEIQQLWQPVLFGIEEDFGGAALMDSVHHIADDRKILLPVVLLGTDSIPKEVRIRRLTPYLADKRFRFKSNSPGTKLLVEQLRSFPIASHDDGPDALEYAIRLLNLMLSGQVLPPVQRP